MATSYWWTMEAAGDGDTSEGPTVETSLMIGENGEPVVGILFPETDTEPLNLLIVVDPTDATNVSHGTDPASVRPATTELILTGGAAMEAPITWNDPVCEYEGDEFNPAIWKATGTVDLTDVKRRLACGAPITTRSMALMPRRLPLAP